MILINVGQLRDYTEKIFKAAGANKKNAKIVANALVSANLCGHDSHGVIRIGQYVKLIKKGDLAPNAEPVVARDTGNAILINGQRGFGQVTVHFGVRTVLNRMAKNEICVVGHCNLNHLGRLSDAVELLAKKGYVAFAFCNGGGPNVAAFGSRDRIFGTNPLACAFPKPNGQVLLIDFATAALAEGKLRVAKNQGKKIEPGFVLDKKGETTVDPDDFYKGGVILPMGRHKGSALSLMLELMGGVLTGAGCSIFDDYTEGNGMTLFCIKPNIFRSKSEFLRDVVRIEEAIKNAETAKGVKNIFLPGEMEKIAYQKRLKEGIPFDANSLKDILDAGDGLGVKRLGTVTEIKAKRKN